MNAFKLLAVGGTLAFASLVGTGASAQPAPDGMRPLPHHGVAHGHHHPHWHHPHMHHHHHHHAGQPTRHP